MARIVREPKLDTPTARAKLKPSGKPVFRAIDTNLHVGYRRNQVGGKWVARFYLGDERYAVETIGAADDVQDADGDAILTWSQAQARARSLDAARRQPVAVAGPLTVGEALDAYVNRLDAERSKSAQDGRKRIERHIRPALGSKLVAELTRDDIAAWRNEMADRPRHVRGKRGGPSRELAAPDTEDEKRRRKATANRNLTVLKAALNQAFQDRTDVASDSAWKATKPFAETDHPRIRYFTADEVRRLVNAAQGSFRDLVNAGLFTGARYSELIRLRVGDFNPDAGTVFVAVSKSGKARHVVLTAEGRRCFAQLAAGRGIDDFMLRKDDGSAWGPAHQLRPMAAACKAARITGGSFHVLRHTNASHLAMSGISLQIIAQNLGHADTRMTEKHYAHLSPSHVADTIRKFAPTFGTLGADLVVQEIRASS